MKVIFLVIIYIICIILLGLALADHHRHTSVATKMRDVLASAFVMTLAYSGVFWVNHLSACSFVYACYFLCTIGLIKNLADLMVVYTNSFNYKKIINNLGTLFMVADAIVLFYSAYKGNLATFSSLCIDQLDYIYAPVDYGMAYTIHLVISYIMIIGTVHLLLLKTYTVPSNYRKKFYIPALGVMGVVAVNGYFILSNNPIDFTTIFIGLAALIFNYYIVEYVPDNLTGKSFRNMLDELNNMIVFFDVDDNCIYANRRFKDFIGEDYSLDYITEVYKKWLSTHKEYTFYTDRIIRFNEEVESEGEKRFLELDYRRNYDDLGVFVGAVFNIKDNTEQIREFNQRQKRIAYDMVSGIYTREFFFEKVDQVIKENPGVKYIMWSSNVVGFKMYNSMFGESQGNRLLRRIGELLEERTPKGSVYGRISADQFCMLAREDGFNVEALSSAMMQVREEFTTDIYRMRIQAGAYHVTDTAEPVSYMCEKARLAAESIKNDYDATFCEFKSSMLDNAVKERRLIANLDKALASGEFYMYLQPHISKAKHVYGAEALVRWITADGTVISPGEFIPVFERNGLVLKIDKFMWESAVKTLAKWKAAGRSDLYISVNISATDFYHVDLYKEFTSLVEKYDVDPHNLELEITETVMLDDVVSKNALLGRLREYGFAIAIDDFGSGHSSLGMIKDITADILKIDMTFLKKTELTSEEKQWAILKEIVNIANVLHMKTVVEGVEELEQVERLYDLGCDVFQGYYFARPETLEDFEKRVGITN